MGLLKWWPVFLLLALFPAAYFLNPDGVITPALRFKGINNGVILIVSGTVGTVEMILWFLGWGGVTDLIAGWLRDDVNFARKIAGEVKKDGYVDGVKVYFARKHKKLTEKADKLWTGLKAGSYLTFFAVGCLPTP